MTEEEILSAATDQFKELGLKFTMLDVAKSLHIAKKTIYQFYPSKEEMMIAMLDHGFEEIQKNKKAILDSDLSDQEKIKEVMIAMPDQYLIIDFRLLSDLNEKYPNAYICLRNHLENGWEPVIKLLKSGMKKGTIRKVNIPVLRAMITASFEMFLSTDALKEAKVTYKDALQDMMDIVMNGIGG